MSEYIIDKPQNDIYSTDVLTRMRYYPFTKPTKHVTSQKTWLSTVYGMFFNISSNKKIIFIHNDNIFDNIVKDNELGFKQYHIFFNSTLTRMAEKNNNSQVNTFIKGWDVIGNMGSILFPELCTGKLIYDGSLYIYQDTLLCSWEITRPRTSIFNTN